MTATLTLPFDGMTLESLTEFVKTAVALGCEAETQIFPAMESPDDPYTIVGVELVARIAGRDLAEYSAVEL